MNPFISWAINIILKWAYSLKPADFVAAYTFVTQAQQKFRESTDKRKWVQEQLAGVLGSRASGRAINFLLEMAVAKLGNAK